MPTRISRSTNAQRLLCVRIRRTFLAAPIRGGIRVSQIPQTLPGLSCVQTENKNRLLSDFVANETDTGSARSPRVLARGSEDCDRVSPSRPLPPFSKRAFVVTSYTPNEKRKTYTLGVHFEHTIGLILLAVERVFVRSLFSCKVRHVAEARRMGLELEGARESLRELLERYERQRESQALV
jgi:hypothetical protein